jgi:hypothetical protein
VRETIWIPNRIISTGEAHPANLMIMNAALDAPYHSVGDILRKQPVEQLGCLIWLLVVMERKVSD